MTKKDEPKKYCSFCNKDVKEVGPLVEGLNSNFICIACVHRSDQLLTEEFKKRSREISGEFKIPSPKEVVDHLNEYIVGQEIAKQTLAVGVVNHYKRLHDPEKGRYADVEIDKSNILLIGPTGSGKTLLAETLAKFMKVPFAIGDATTLTEAGYVGEDVENLVLKLLYSCDHDIEQAERGILFIDEIDKIGRTNQNVSITRDVSGEGVQQALLKMLEGTVANVPPTGGRKHPEQQYIRVDTTDILFICGGTFVGLDKIVNKRIGKKAIGFGVSQEPIKESADNWAISLTTEDLQEFGMIPELLGRLPVITTCNPLDIDTLVRILTEPKNALLKQFAKLFDMDGVDLQFEDAAIRAIAELAKKKNTGARGLRGVVETVVNPWMYALPEYKGSVLTVTKEMVSDSQASIKAA